MNFYHTFISWPQQPQILGCNSKIKETHATFILTFPQPNLPAPFPKQDCKGTTFFYTGKPFFVFSKKKILIFPKTNRKSNRYFYTFFCAPTLFLSQNRRFLPKKP